MFLTNKFHIRDLQSKPAKCRRTYTFSPDKKEDAGRRNVKLESHTLLNSIYVCNKNTSLQKNKTSASMTNFLTLISIKN